MPCVQRLGAFAAICGLLLSSSARADTPSSSAKPPSVRAAGERRIARPNRAPATTLSEAGENRRVRRVSLEIPERLQAALARKIEQRIARSVGRSKELRVEALALLRKFVAEADPTVRHMMDLFDAVLVYVDRKATVAGPSESREEVDPW